MNATQYDEDRLGEELARTSVPEELPGTDSFKVKTYTCICGRAVRKTLGGGVDRRGEKALNLNGTPHVCGDPHAVTPATKGYTLRR